MAEPINLNRLAYFAAVVDTGSFTRAAERLGVSKTVVSQQVARLEADVGVSLLTRTTRSVQLTEAGQGLHARCLAILREADEAFAELSDAAQEPLGTLRITAPNDFGSFILAPVAAAFTRRHPKCRVELVITDAKLDLIGQRFDLAIRVGWLDDSSALARRLGTFRQIAVAHPAVAERHPVAVPDDLPSWPFIANLSLKDPGLWTFRRGAEERTLRVQPIMSVNATPAALTAVQAGGGFAVLPEFLVAEEIAAGRLVQLLPDWSLPSGGIHAVYPATRFRPLKVRAFVEMLRDTRNWPTRLRWDSQPQP
ncbi:DNA-binding transcriptional LysR family regulator [Azospirillum brasilense]|uniref:DNA-binding transcriptional LysR family regulator n=1 Tax=Azospirillum brasilense TaxID=192 RepID=A0A560AU03_AZOBR|nr:LysR family transcriptional regulator [Azospirillum brasilense]TWA63867.1 DNA-binding transcriptional LysR family regulator [Azospirillum brasilense]